MKRHLGALIGAVAVVAAWAALGPVAAIAASWLVFSPDAVAGTLRGGGAGALGAAVTAGADYLADEWRAGGPARRRRRTARRDRMWEAGGWSRRLLALEHAVVIAGRLLSSTTIAVARAGAVIPAGAVAGARAAREQRNPTRTRRGGAPSHTNDVPAGPAARPRTVTGEHAPRPAVTRDSSLLRRPVVHRDDMSLVRGAYGP